MCAFYIYLKTIIACLQPPNLIFHWFKKNKNTVIDLYSLFDITHVESLYCIFSFMHQMLKGELKGELAQGISKILWSSVITCLLKCSLFGGTPMFVLRWCRLAGWWNISVLCAVLILEQFQRQNNLSKFWWNYFLWLYVRCCVPSLHPISTFLSLIIIWRKQGSTCLAYSIDFTY